jgi:hypothetical protein
MVNFCFEMRDIHAAPVLEGDLVLFHSVPSALFCGQKVFLPFIPCVSV